MSIKGIFLCFLLVKHNLKLSGWRAELANSIENAIAIAFWSTIAIAIDKAVFQLLLLLLIRASLNY